MPAYSQILTVNWGESDLFGLVYSARGVAWFNEIEHELFRRTGHPINRMINRDRSAFVMGEIEFRFAGPAAYGDQVECTLTVLEVRDKTVHWHCNAGNLRTGQQVTEGKATRVFARILEDGNLASQSIPQEIRDSLSQFRANGT